MNLRDLRYLVALADHRHFGRAAAASFVSQPTLSTQIRKLEEELGVPLVERAPRKVMLTPAGLDIAERARRIVSDVEQMKEAARRSQDPEAGTVRLGMFPTLGPYLLPHVVPRIRARFPSLELLLVEEKSDVLLARLREAGSMPACWHCRCTTTSCMSNSCSRNLSCWPCRKRIRWPCGIR
jgi:LysR family hydrogen peroxide-inducible transcriptional activator